MFWWKFLVESYFRGNDFATIKNFEDLMKIFGSNLFHRKWFCNHKNFLPKYFRWKFLVQIYSRGNDYEPINIFRPKSFFNFLCWNLIPRNDFETIKNLGPKIFWWKFFIRTYSRGNDFATINIFEQKMVDEIFWMKPVPEEIILEP